MNAIVNYYKILEKKSIIEKFPKYRDIIENRYNMILKINNDTQLDYIDKDMKIYKLGLNDISYCDIENKTHLISLEALIQYNYPKFMILDLLTYEYLLKHKAGGRPPKLSLEDYLNMFYKYYNTHEKTNYRKLAKDFKINSSNIYDNIKWVYSVLLKYKLIVILEYNGYKIHYIDFKVLSNLYTTNFNNIYS